MNSSPSCLTLGAIAVFWASQHSCSSSLPTRLPSSTALPMSSISTTKIPFDIWQSPTIRLCGPCQNSLPGLCRYASTPSKRYTPRSVQWSITPCQRLHWRQRHRYIRPFWRHQFWCTISGMAPSISSGLTPTSPFSKVTLPWSRPGRQAPGHFPRKPSSLSAPRSRSPIAKDGSPGASGRDYRP